MTGLGDKLHKLEHKLFDSGDHHAQEDKAAEQARDAAAEERLRALQAQNPTGKSDVSTVPAGELETDETDAPVHSNANLPPRHHEADYTALRPESQEKADGRGTAGDDLAI